MNSGEYIEIEKFGKFEYFFEDVYCLMKENIFKFGAKDSGKITVWDRNKECAVVAEISNNEVILQQYAEKDDEIIAVKMTGIVMNLDTLKHNSSEFMRAIEKVVYGEEKEEYDRFRPSERNNEIEAER